jgi:hypothetical protein
VAVNFAHQPAPVFVALELVVREEFIPLDDMKAPSGSEADTAGPAEGVVRRELLPHLLGHGGYIPGKKTKASTRRSG